jgi:hypothetical protein
LTLESAFNVPVKTVGKIVGEVCQVQPGKQGEKLSSYLGIYHNRKISVSDAPEIFIMVKHMRPWLNIPVL